MKSILGEFARGNISPEPCFFKRNSHYARMMKTVAENEQKLFAALTDDRELKETLKQLSAAQAEVGLISGIDKFVLGYRLGVLMMVEVFAGKDDLMNNGEDC